jgi:hypothetical protein
MTEYTEQEFNLSKENVVNLCDRIKTFLLKDFDKKLLQHKKLDHKWYVQGTIHGICRSLLIDKQVAIYLILGSNPRRTGWGELKTKYDMEPLKFILRKEVVDQGKKLLQGYGFKLFFTDTNRNGDFHMKITFYPYKEYKVTVSEDTTHSNSYANAVKSSKEIVQDKVIKQTEKGAKFIKMVTVLAESSDEE